MIPTIEIKLKKQGSYLKIDQRPIIVLAITIVFGIGFNSGINKKKLLMKKIYQTKNFTFFTLLVGLFFYNTTLQAQITVAPLSCYPQYATAAEMDAAAAADYTDGIPFATWLGAYTEAVATGATSIEFSEGTYIVGVTTNWGDADGGFNLTNGMSVSCNGNCVIDNSGNGSSQLAFATIASDGAAISGFTFIDFTGNSSGGAVGVLGDITGWQITDCNFDGCDKAGDALVVAMGSTGQGVISGCNFYNNNFTTGSAMVVTGSNNTTTSLSVVNSVYSCNSRIVAGGAVQIHSAVNVGFTDCSFEGNLTNSAIGGAISLRNDANVGLTNTDFSCNSADVNTQDDGGAVSVESGSSLTIDGGTYYNNFCKRYGGAIYMNGTITSPVTVAISNAVFDANQTTTSSSDGGAVYSRSYYTLSIDGCLFLNNSTIDKGSAYGTYTNTQNPATTTISNSTFTGNTGGSSEGAINTSSGNTSITMTNCVISGNTPRDVEEEAGTMVLNTCMYGVTSGGVEINGGTSSAPVFDANYQEASGYGWTGVYTATGSCSACLSTAPLANNCPLAGGSISNFVFEDVNEDGTSTGDPGMSGVAVDLYSCAGVLIASVTTDATGFYAFGGLSDGCYYIEFTPPGGFVATAQNTGGDPTIDSDISASNQTPQITISTVAGTSNSTDATSGNTHYTSYDAGFRAAPLPVELHSFIGKRKDCQVELSWITLSEVNNDYFLIEKSEEGDSFEELMKINGAGNSFSTENYAFTDRVQTGSKGFYYRLKQVDFNGLSTYSSVIFVSMGNCQVSEKQTKVFPNPFLEEFNLTIEDGRGLGEVEVVLYNAHGQILQAFSLQAGDLNAPYQIGLYDLLPGIYILRISGSQLNESHIIVKQKD